MNCQCGLGVVAPVASILEQNLGISGWATGWATSVITALAAGAGLPVAQWTQRHDPARLFANGLGLLAVAGVATGGLAGGPWLLIGLRAFSGVGYLLIVISGPAVLVRLTTTGARSAVLGLWGLCIPGGLAVATATGGLLAGPLGWRVWLATPGICAGVLLLIARRRWSTTTNQPADRANHVADNALSDDRTGGLRGPVLLAAGFGLVTMTGVAVVTLLPAYLQSTTSLSGREAGSYTALVAVTSVPASVLAGWLLHRRAGARPLLITGLVMPVGAWLSFAMPVPVGAQVGGAMLTLFANGLVVSAAYATIPAVANHRTTVQSTTGLLTQLGSAGTLLGPPLFASIAATSPSAIPLGVLGCAIPGVTLLLLSEGRRSPGTSERTRRIRRPIGLREQVLTAVGPAGVVVDGVRSGGVARGCAGSGALVGVFGWVALWSVTPSAGQEDGAPRADDPAWPESEGVALHERGGAPHEQTDHAGQSPWCPRCPGSGSGGADGHGLRGQIGE